MIKDINLTKSMASQFILESGIDNSIYKHLYTQSEKTSNVVEEELLLRKESIIASILYKFLQYKHIEKEDIEKEFGVSVLDLTMSIVKVSRLDKKSIVLQADSFIHLVLALVDDPRAILIVLAEQLNKMRDFKDISDEYKTVILQEIIYLYAPIAHRLGLYAIKTELEERWMSYAQSEIYNDIQNKLAESQGERDRFISNFISPIKKKMRKQKIECEIKGRPKSIYSIWGKMKKQNVDVDGVYDKFAIRIIIDCNSIEEEKELCWKAYSIVTENYRPYPKRLRDWISAPKSSGYESLHTTVETDNDIWVEVQIRTRRMDDIAENGQAAHWKYKEGAKGDSTVSWLSSMKEALSNPSELENQSNNIKNNLYSKDIFVFTPDEQIKKLRVGATVLDFAFSIHTNVGIHCTGAKINGKIVSIKEFLKSGDIVEIQTTKRQKPNVEWLNFVSSPSAKSKIKRAIREAGEQTIDIGRETLRRKFKKNDIDLNDINCRKVADYFNLSDVVTLYEEIGNQKIDLLKIKRAFIDEVKAEDTEIIEIVESKKEVNLDTIILDNNISDIDYSLARCCSPEVGDDVFGFITVSKGLKVHKVNCKNAPDLLANYYPRIVSVDWGVNQKSKYYLKKINLLTSSENLQLNRLTNIFDITKGISLQQLKLEPITENRMEISIKVQYHNEETLNHLLLGIEKLGSFKIL